jgi:hypothetical protein
LNFKKSKLNNLENIKKNNKINMEKSFKKCLIKFDSCIYHLENLESLNDLIYQLCLIYIRIIKEENDIINEPNFKICDEFYYSDELSDFLIESMHTIKKFKVYGLIEEENRYIPLLIEKNKNQLNVGQFDDQIYCFM